jgi:hypothetical protein
MEKSTLAFVLCLAVLCGAFGAAFVGHRWSAPVDGYGFSPEMAATVAENRS